MKDEFNEVYYLPTKINLMILLITAKTLIYREEDDKTYIVYICNNCKKTLGKKGNNLKFRERCDKFIKKYMEN